MSLRVTKAGTYEVRFREPHPEEPGKWIQKQETFDKRRDAVDYDKKVHTQISEGDYIPESSLTVQDIADRWFAKKKNQSTYERSTLIAWENHIDNYITPTFGDLLIQELNIETIEQGAAEWNERVSAKTVNKILTTLTAILGLAKRYKLIKDNPAEEAERLNLSTEEENEIVTPDQVYSKEELKKLIEATESGSMARVVVMFPALTGVRIGELLGATWEATDLRAGKFEVRINRQDGEKGSGPILKAPKTKSGRRVIPLSKELIHELRLWKLKCPKSEEGLIIANELGKPLHRKSASKLLDHAIDKVNEKAEGSENLKRLTPHGLRHTFASLLLADGVPVPEVSSLLGHKNSAITLTVYAHFVGKETRAVHNLAASIFTGGE